MCSRTMWACHFFHRDFTILQFDFFIYFFNMYFVRSNNCLNMGSKSMQIEMQIEMQIHMQIHMQIVYV